MKFGDVARCHCTMGAHARAMLTARVAVIRLCKAGGVGIVGRSPTRWTIEEVFKLANG